MLLDTLSLEECHHSQVEILEHCSFQIPASELAIENWEILAELIQNHLKYLIESRQ